MPMFNQSPVSGGGSRPLGAFTGLPTLRSALLATQAQIADTVVLNVGDSTMRGVGSGGGGVGQFPAGMSQMLAASCLWVGDAAAENVVGRSGIVLPTYDDRIVEGGWTTLSSTLGGEGWQANSAVADFVYTPKVPVSVVDVYYIGNPGAGSFSVKVDGRAYATISCGRTAGLYKQRISMPLGMHTIAASWVSLNGYLVGFDAWNGQRKRARFINTGRTGWKTADWLDAANAWSPFNGLGIPGASLIDISLGINDVINGVATATTQANLVTLVNKAKATGADVTLTTPNPVLNYDSAMDALQAAYVAVAAATGAKLIDYYTSVGGRQANSPAGTWADSMHPAILGYAGKAAYWLTQVEA